MVANINITKAQKDKLCGRKGVNPTQLNRFLDALSGNKERDLETLSTLTLRPSTRNAIKAGIDIAYSIRM
jgi:hypothetical protein